MSEDERKVDSFGETFKDEAEDPALYEALRRVQVAHNMQNRPGTGNAMSCEPPADLFHRMSGSRNPICSGMSVEGGQNVVRSSGNVQQSVEYFLSQSTSNKRSIAKTNDSASGCNIFNKKMRYCEMNPNESSCQTLDLSIRGASHETDGIREGKNNTVKRLKVVLLQVLKSVRVQL
ncbi:hypothetical protein CDAR_170641 [Caerostris darwini]|uniref:Uncharacterized protein n=1 Tax=Caerostris darwini TaxID=1538125 RepID=A0AAV4US22_9ARAC|nr:hypothetical protein CDAR_170641 [Caerostris darwini]